MSRRKYRYKISYDIKKFNLNFSPRFVKMIASIYAHLILGGESLGHHIGNFMETKQYEVDNKIWELLFMGFGKWYKSAMDGNFKTRLDWQAGKALAFYKKDHDAAAWLLKTAYEGGPKALDLAV